MVKVQSSKGQIVMDYYNKYNLSLKYEEITTEQPSLIYSVSIFHENTKIFSDNEIYYFNNDARKFIQENNNLEFTVSDNIEGINVYVYYFQPADKWFVSTKKHLNNHEIYKAVVRAITYEKLSFSQLDKNYVYVLKLVSNKFIRFCSYSRFNKYDYIFFNKKINRTTNEISYEDEEHIFQRLRPVIEYKQKYSTIEEFINVNLNSKNLNAFKENGYVRYIGLSIDCVKEGQKVNLNIDSNVYKFLNDLKYDYQKYKLKPIDVLFFNYLLSHDEDFKKRIIEIFKVEYMPTILSVKFGQYEKIIDNICVYISDIYKNKIESQFNSIKYFIFNFNKFIESRKQFIEEKDLPTYVCEYFKFRNTNTFFSVLNTIKKNNLLNFDNQ